MGFCLNDLVVGLPISGKFLALSDLIKMGIATHQLGDVSRAVTFTNTLLFQVINAIPSTTQSVRFS